MTIEEAKNIKLEDYLHSLGYNPVKRQGMNLWYKSPFREETDASFKVNTEINNGMISGWVREVIYLPWLRYCIVLKVYLTFCIKLRSRLRIFAPFPFLFRSNLLQNRVFNVWK